MKKIVLILGLAFIVAVNAGCGGGGDKSKMIAKKWHITKMQSPEMDTMSADAKKQMDGMLEMMKAGTIEFKSDGTQSSEMMGTKESGKWKIMGDTLVVTDSAGKETKSMLKQVTDNSLSIQADQGGKKITVDLEPVK